MAEVQQVTTRSKTKQPDWEAQEEIRKVTKVWIKKTNSANAERDAKRYNRQTSIPTATAGGQGTTR